jgi:hypothetical protein
VFTAQYALSPYIKQIRFVFKGLNGLTLNFIIISNLILFAPKVTKPCIGRIKIPSFFHCGQLIVAKPHFA